MARAYVLGRAAETGTHSLAQFMFHDIVHIHDGPLDGTDSHALTANIGYLQITKCNMTYYVHTVHFMTVQMLLSPSHFS